MYCTNKPLSLVVLLAFLTLPVMMIQVGESVYVFNCLCVLLIDRCGGQFPGETKTPGGDS